MPSKTRYQPTIPNQRPPRLPYTMDIRVLVPGAYSAEGVALLSSPWPAWPQVLKLGPCDAAVYTPIVIPDVPMSCIMRQRYDVRANNPFWNGIVSTLSFPVPYPWTGIQPDGGGGDVGEYIPYFQTY